MSHLHLRCSLLALASLTLSGCAGMLGIEAVGTTPAPFRVEAQAHASAESQAEVRADLRAEATGQATADAHAEVRVQATTTTGAQVTAGEDAAVDVGGIAAWQADPQHAPLPDPFAVAAAMLGGETEVRVASVGVTGAEAEHRGAATGHESGELSIDARVERGSGADARVEDGAGTGAPYTASRPGATTEPAAGYSTGARAEGAAAGGGYADDYGIDARVERPGGATGDVDARVGGDAQGEASLDAGARLDVDARMELQAEAQASAGAEVEVEARGRRVGGGAGVHGRGGRGAHLGALIGGGVVIDGTLTELDELGPLGAVAVNPNGADAQARLDASARVAVGAAVDARVTLEHAQLPTGGGETHLVVRVRGREDAGAPRARARVRVRLVIDRSSSMQAAWGQVMDAARDLVGQLSADDELQIIAYGTRAVEALPTTRVGDGSRARGALNTIRVGGGTNIEAGLRLAYGAESPVHDDRPTLVVLVSDGVPNGGAFTADELAPMAARAKRVQGCRTTVVGFGDEFDAVTLRAIARAGGGAYRVAPDASELATVLESEVGAIARVRARDVKVRVALPAGVRLTEAAGDARITADGRVELSMPALAAGEERALVLGLRVGAGARLTTVARVSVSYRAGGHLQAGDKEVRVARGDARLDADAARAMADADLALALDLAARAVNNGQGADAAAALRAHAARVEASVDVRVRARARASRRVARALQHLVPDASWPERRQVSLRLGALSARLGG